MELVMVRTKTGKRGQFLISRGLFEKHPDDYVLVKVKPVPKPVDTE